MKMGWMKDHGFTEQLARRLLYWRTKTLLVMQVKS